MAIGNIAGHNPIAAQQNAPAQNVNQAPAALQGAHTSKAKLAVRIAAGFLTGGLSEGIRAMAHGIKSAIVKHGRVKEARAQELATARNDAFNSRLTTKITTRSNFHAGPYQAAVCRGLIDLQHRFNGKGLDSTWELSDEGCFNVKYALRNCHDEMTPERLENFIINQIRPEAARNTFYSFVQEFMNSENLNAQPAKELDICQNPALHDLHNRLAACQNADDVQALYNECKEPLENSIRFQNTAYQVRDELDAEAHTAVAERTGLSLETLQTSRTNQALNAAIRPVYAQMASQTTFPDANQIKAAFRDAITQQRATQDAMLGTVQDLPISPALKQHFAFEICCSMKYADNPDIFTKAAEILKNIDTTSISNAMQMPKGTMNESDFSGLFRTLGANLHTNFNAAYGEGLNQLSNGEVNKAKNVLARILLDQHPEVGKAFQAKSEVLDKMEKQLTKDRHMRYLGEKHLPRTIRQAHDFIYDIRLAHEDIQETNTKLLKQLGNPQPIQTTLLTQHKDACLTALRDIRANFGANSIPAGNTVEELYVSPAGRTIVKALVASIKNAKEPVTPQETHKMAHDALHDIAQKTTIQSSLHVLAQNAGHNITNFSESDIEDLYRYSPDLKKALDTASDASSIHELLQGDPASGKLIQYKVDFAAHQRAFYAALTKPLLNPY